MSEITVKVEYEDVTFKIICDAEREGNDISFTIMDIHDEMDNDLNNTCHICCLPEHWESLDGEEISSLPRVKATLAWFDSSLGQLAVYGALEQLILQADCDNYFLED